MGNRDVFDGDASVFAEVPKMVPVNVVPRSVIMLFGRLTAFFAVVETSGLYLIHLENLSMVMYTYRKTTWRWPKRPDHVQSPASKRPRSWDGLQFLCQHVDLLGKKLTSFTMSDEVFCIRDGRVPVKTSSESFTD